MKYVMAFAGGSARGTHLEDGSTRQSLAEECRKASLSFMSGVAAGWDKLDLAHWLIGPYAQATRHAKHGERVAIYTDSAKGGTQDGTIEGALIRGASIEALVTRVRGQLLASLEKAALDHGTLDFTDETVERGLVRKIVDADGHDAWVPVDAPRVRLRDRLRSLFVADCLNAPYTYAELFVCHRCEAVVFDDRAKRAGICGAHRLSGFVQTNIDSPASSRSGSAVRKHITRA